MLYLENIPSLQTIPVAKTRTVSVGDTFTLTLTGVADRTTRTMTVTDSQLSQLYYFVQVTLAEPLRPGEYRFTLSQGGVDYESGLMKVTGNGIEWKGWTKPTITYKEYGNREE